MKCSALVDGDDGAGRRVEEIDGQQQVLARRRKHRKITLKSGVDGTEIYERGFHGLDDRRIATRLRDALEPEMSLLTEPIEGLSPEHDPVLGSDPRECRAHVVIRHG